MGRIKYSPLPSPPARSKYVIGVDVGTNLGVGVLRIADGKAELESSGVLRLQRKAHETKGVQMRVLSLEMSKILEKYSRDCPCMLGYEEIRFHGFRKKGGDKEGVLSGVDAAHCYGAFSWRIMELCEEYGILYQGLHLGMIRKLAVGAGNADKEWVRKFLIEKFGDRFGELRDETDAVAVALAMAKTVRWIG